MAEKTIDLSEHSYPIISVLQGFFQLLHKNEVTLTPADKSRVLESIQAIDIRDVKQVKAALRATCARSAEQATIIDRLFTLYFQNTGWLDQKLGEPVADASELSDVEAIQALQNGDSAALEMALREAAEEVQLERIESFMQLGYFSYQMLEALGFYQSNSGGGSGSGETEAREQLREIVQEYVQRALDGTDLDAKESARTERMLDRSFLQVTPAEREMIKAEIRRIALALKTKTIRRRKKMRRGTVDFHRTMRKNLINDAVPIQIQYKDKIIKKPELILVLDMSESVRSASEFLLLFVYTMQELFSKVRSFIFAGNLVEVTDTLRNNTFEDAVAEILQGQHLNIWASSNFGRSFNDFYRDHMDACRSKSQMIILGDARNNFNPTRADLLGEFRRRIKTLYWLNPEAKSSWGLGDSAMYEYEPYCDEVLSVRNVKELSAFADRLLKH